MTGVVFARLPNFKHHPRATSFGIHNLYFRSNILFIIFEFINALQNPGTRPQNLNKGWIMGSQPKNERLFEVNSGRGFELNKLLTTCRYFTTRVPCFVVQWKRISCIFSLCLLLWKYLRRCSRHAFTTSIIQGWPINFLSIQVSIVKEKKNDIYYKVVWK